MSTLIILPTGEPAIRFSKEELEILIDLIDEVPSSDIEGLMAHSASEISLILDPIAGVLSTALSELTKDA